MDISEPVHFLPEKFHYGPEYEKKIIESPRVGLEDSD